MIWFLGLFFFFFSFFLCGGFCFQCFEKPFVKVQLSSTQVAIILINMLPREIFVYLYVAVGSYLEYLRDLETKIDQDWDSISSSLEEMRKSLFSQNGCLINLTSDWKNLEKSSQHIAKFLDSLPSSPSLGSDPWLSRLPSVNEAIVVPTQVTTSCLNAFSNHGEIITPWQFGIVKIFNIILSVVEG